MKTPGADPPEQAHHIVQNAAVNPAKDVALSNDAPAINLVGSKGDRSTPHGKASEVQRLTPLGGTYGDESAVAYIGLKAAGMNKQRATKEVDRADAFFKDQKGWNDSTPTAVPKDRMNHPDRAKDDQ
ncbi:MAG: hypothetical protein IT577_15100 [Verrucomicrobiae bacterium]|nr:hypothetical protein [Verrucomicrobiae bacterium]